MKRYVVRLMVYFYDTYGLTSHKVCESFNDKADALYRARVLKACYGGKVSIYDNNTGNTEYIEEV